MFSCICELELSLPREELKKLSLHMPSNPLPMLSREVSPLSYQSWQRQNRDESAILQAQFAGWLEIVSEGELMFKQHVYQNSDLHEMDLRQHRIMLHSLLHDGEMLAFGYKELGFRTGK